jgi:hypothetical protein
VKRGYLPVRWCLRIINTTDRSLPYARQVVGLYGTVRLSRGLPPNRLHTLEGAVQHTPSSFLGLISKALRDNYEDVAKEPLPQRWVDLIHYLNERVEAERHQPERPSKSRPIH